MHNSIPRSNLQALHLTPALLRSAEGTAVVDDSTLASENAVNDVYVGEIRREYLG